MLPDLPLWAWPIVLLVLLAFGVAALSPLFEEEAKRIDAENDDRIISVEPVELMQWPSSAATPTPGEAHP